jgi:hypothetical protein
MNEKEQGMDKIASSKMEMSAFALFERYWVLGESMSMIYGEQKYDMTAFKRKGIPTRTGEDAKKLKEGVCDVSDLWEGYLSDFQIQLAREMKTMRLSDIKENSEL